MNKSLFGRHLPSIVETREVHDAFTKCSNAVKKSKVPWYEVIQNLKIAPKDHALHMRHSSLFFSEQAMPSSCFFLSAVLSTVNWIALAAGFVLK